jgi:prephenate dehydratase
MRIGIQGEPGSACHEAAEKLIVSLSSDDLVSCLTNANKTLHALETGQIDVAVIVGESPLGTAVEETARALAAHSSVEILKEYSAEVRHCVMTLSDINPVSVRAIASHEVPLMKHREFLLSRFPDVKLVPVEDSGLAAKLLARGELPRETAVVAVRRAAELYGLKMIDIFQNSCSLRRR